MRRYLLASVSVAALAAASPADAAPPMPYAYNWTGWYVGGNIGYSWGTASSNYTEPGFASYGLPSSFSGSESLNGIIGGAQAGYNWQANSRWVLGIEADIQGSGEQGSKSSSNGYSYIISDCEGPCIARGAVNQTQQTEILWFGTVRGRAGVLVNPTLWLYGTGGLAYGEIRTSGTVTDTACTPFSTCSWSYGGSATNIGWTVGAGLEGVFPNMPHWTWKIEYLYIDFGSVSGTGFDTDFESPYSWSARVTDNILRVGVNYQFH